MKIKVNGKFFEVEENILLVDFVRGMGLNPLRCVAEVNGVALVKENFLLYILKENDVVEVMQLVAGG